MLPDQWLGKHVEIRDEALAAAEKRGIKSMTLIDFAVALSLAEDWGDIPGIDGPPERWDFKLVPLPVIGWINQTVIQPFVECFQVPKVSSSPSPNGSKSQKIRAGMTQTDPAMATGHTNSEPLTAG